MQYIISVDQSTSASKVFLVNAQGQIVRRFSKAHRQSYPFPGWAEHDAQEIWKNVRAGIYAVLDGLDRSQVAAIAISNQRETTVLWDRASGAPLAPAVVWQDVRAQALCDALKESTDAVRKKTGLALSPYYPAAKAAHVLRENPALREKMQQGALCIGTVDS
ncbi:MAG: glycerol kinase, partial [Oscillospiraceae bacterium]|nr:glycerol kinase [Oscillospiraceae bacterium]